MKAFHAYDIRGIWETELNSEDVYKTGFFLPGLLNAKKILLGRDARLSSPVVREYLSRGITDAGADVYDAGLVTTPMIYWATAKFDFDASVMITASHNPKEYNGLKISQRQALPVGYDNGLKEIEKKIEVGHPVKKASLPGIKKDFDIRSDYVAFLKHWRKDFSNLRIAVDCSNGMAGLFIRDVLGDNCHYINEQPDGNFPGHEPNPLVAENIVQLNELVKKENCDVGVIYDGDADRVMFVDENADFIPPDLMIALLGHYFLEEKKNRGNVLQDIRSSKAVKEYVEKLGGRMHMWKVGRAFAALKLREIDGIYGGELAGHYYFRDFYYSDSGILASLIILGLISKFKKEGHKVSDLMKKIGKYANSGEINFRIERKEAAMETVKNYFMDKEEPIAYYNFDGYRIEFADWWFSIRQSNTEPHLRLLVEAVTDQVLKDRVEEIKNLIKKYR